VCAEIETGAIAPDAGLARIEAELARVKVEAGVLVRQKCGI
jgi:hypothetical protein